MAIHVPTSRRSLSVASENPGGTRLTTHGERADTNIVRPKGLIQDPKRDAAAIVLLIGLLVSAVVPLLVDHYCQSSIGIPLLWLGPTLLAASIVIRNPTGWNIVLGTVLAIPLFIIEGIAAFVLSSPEHCPLILG